jgi:TolB-like protein/Tfp pilus assembly protein PilF
MVRQLTAIMFTDMVGYTALMQTDERRAREDRDRQRRVLRAVMAEWGGRILEIHGDGTLSVFPSAVDAVRAAREIQEELQREPRVPLRIGIHTGDVIHDEDGVFGDGVNVAARIQSLSVPGGILVSAKVFDELKNQPDIGVRSLGEFNLKNVQRPMEVWAVAGEGLAVPDERVLASSRARECRSVAVLPFVNMSSDPENEFFSDGVTEEIINALTRVNGLQVTARTSSFAYKGRNDDIRKIAAELGVGSILEGSVRKAGSRVRITAQLIDARDGYHLFSEVYDRSIDDIFATQDEIARAIVGRLEGRLLDPAPREVGLPREDPTLVRTHTHDSEAYTEYLKGLHSWRRWTPEGARAAIAHYRRSAELDPHCALPWSGIASAYTFLGAIGYMKPHEAFPRAETAARRAVELESEAGESYMALGAVQLFYHWDFDAAYRSLQKGLSKNPGSAELRHVYGLYLSAVGDVEAAVEELEGAVQLDPLSIPLNQALGEVYAVAGRLDDAEVQLRRTLELDPGFRASAETLGWVHVAQGRYEEALASFESVVEVTGDPFKFIPHRAWALVRMGREREARALGALLEGRGSEHPDQALELDWAVYHLGLGDVERALDFLEEAVDQRLGAVIFLRRSFIWIPLREHPRYRALLEQIGLPAPRPT